MHDSSTVIIGKNAVLEALRSGKTVDRIFIQEGKSDAAVSSIVRLAKKQGTAVIDYVPKQRLDEMTDGVHQGIIAYMAAYTYSTVDEILALAREKKEDPFIIILDEVEDPHNIGAIIRTANCVGAHGVILPKRHSPGLTAAVVKASAGAISYTKVAKVTNITRTMEDLKKEGLWFACADMDGQSLYKTNLTGPIGLVIGNEGKGVSPLVKRECDMIASIPMKGEIESLNASVAAGILSYEVLRQRSIQNGK